MTEIRTALVTGADRGFGLSVARELLQRGWRVFAGRVLRDYPLLDEMKEQWPELYPIWLDVSNVEEIESAAKEIEAVSGKLDLLVSNAALMGPDGASTIGGENPIDFAMLEKAFAINSMAAPLLVDRLLPLLEKGDMKRLFFTSSEISSIKLMHRTGDVRYAMTKAALNLSVRMMFNDLRPRGYTFRLYQPGWMKRVLPDGSRMVGPANVDPDDSAKEAMRQIFEERVDEDRLQLVDYLGKELAF